MNIYSTSGPIYLKSNAKHVDKLKIHTLYVVLTFCKAFFLTDGSKEDPSVDWGITGAVPLATISTASA